MMLSLLTYTGAVREKLKWADGKLVKEAIEREVLTVVWLMSVGHSSLPSSFLPLSFPLSSLPSSLPPPSLPPSLFVFEDMLYVCDISPVAGSLLGSQDCRG